MNSGESLFSKERLFISQLSNRQQYTLFWNGECDFRDPMATLSPILNSLVPQIDERKLVIDFTGLSFMNSSSLTPILMFIRHLCIKGIPVHLIYDARLSWQRTTASSMRAISRSLKLLTIEMIEDSESAL